VLALWGTLGAAAVASGLSGSIPLHVMWRGLAEPVALAVLSGWYFYAKRNVVEYFREISRSEPRGPKKPSTVGPTISGGRSFRERA
jgi:hypothetical protein